MRYNCVTLLTHQPFTQEVVYTTTGAMSSLISLHIFSCHASYLASLFSFSNLRRKEKYFHTCILLETRAICLLVECRCITHVATMSPRCSQCRRAGRSHSCNALGDRLQLVSTWLRTNCRKIERWGWDRRKALWQWWTILTHTIILKWIWETWKNKTNITDNYMYSFPHTHHICINTGKG
jgi:hypothetical protein